MTIKTATPYLILNGKARAAIAHYQSALGASVVTVNTFGEVNQSCPDAMRDNVMHAVLQLGAAQLMLSDGPGAGELPPSGAVQIALDFADEEQTRQCFAALAETGKVVEPLFDAPWGALFGVVTDSFGIHWMFNCAKG